MAPTARGGASEEEARRMGRREARRETGAILIRLERVRVEGRIYL